MKKIKKWLLNALSKSLPKIVIAFSTHGCQAQEYRFQWIGYVVKTYYKFDGKVDFYGVNPIVLGSSEARNYKDSPLPYQECWQIQHLVFNIYIHYI